MSAPLPAASRVRYDNRQQPLDAYMGYPRQHQWHICSGRNSLRSSPAAQFPRNKPLFEAGLGRDCRHRVGDKVPRLQPHERLRTAWNRDNIEPTAQWPDNRTGAAPSDPNEFLDPASTRSAGASLVCSGLVKPALPRREINTPVVIPRFPSATPLVQDGPGPPVMARQPWGRPKLRELWTEGRTAN